MTAANEERASSSRASKARSRVEQVDVSISDALEALEREILRIELIDVRRP